MTQNPENPKESHHDRKVKATNSELLARLKEVLPKEAYKAAKKAASDGPLALKLQRNPRGDQVFQVVALRSAQNFGGTPFHARDPEWTLKPQTGMHRFESQAKHAVPQMPTERTMVRGGKAKSVRTLDAQGQALRWEGTRTEIQHYLDKHDGRYAIVQRIGQNTGFALPRKDDDMATPAFGRGGYEQDMKEAVAFLKSQGSQTPAVVYVAGTRLLEHDAKEYRSVGSWGDVIAEVATNLIQFAGSAGGGAHEAAGGLVGELAGAQAEIAGAGKDLKDAKEVPSKVGEAFHGKSGKKHADPKLSSIASDVLGSRDPQQVYDEYGLAHADKNADWSRKFIEENLQFHVCVATDETDRLPGALAQKRIPMEVEVFPGDEVDEPMLVYSLGDVGEALNELMNKIMGEIQQDVVKKTQRQRMFAARGPQKAQALPRMPKSGE